MDRDGELRTAGRAAGDALRGAVRVVGDVHAAVTRRVSGALPYPGRAVADVQGLVAAAVYGAVAGAHRVVPVIVGEVAGAAAPSGGQVLTGSRWGPPVLSALNGVWGDRLAASYRTLAVRAAVRPGRADAAVEASSRVVVFLHGLAEDDSCWRWGGGAGYGDVLREDGFSAVYVRYNSGLPVASNGATVSRLLGELVERWPTPVGELHLVGHSMGGLVASSACRHAESFDLAWMGHLRSVVTLGTPHLGAPLATGVAVAERMLDRMPETRPLARILATRSAGIRDLRSGPAAPPPSEISQGFVAATLTRELGHPVGRLIGDGLVPPGSALREDRGAADAHPAAGPTAGPAGRAHVGRTHHLALLNHPRVAALLQDWLASARSR